MVIRRSGKSSNDWMSEVRNRKVGCLYLMWSTCERMSIIHDCLF